MHTLTRTHNYARTPTNPHTHTHTHFPARAHTHAHTYRRSLWHGQRTAGGDAHGSGLNQARVAAAERARTGGRDLAGQPRPDQGVLI